MDAPTALPASIFHPGPVRTGFGKSANAGPGEAMEAEDVGKIVMTMLDLPASANFYEALALPLSSPFLGRG